jgi:hypothetical protein
MPTPTSFATPGIARRSRTPSPRASPVAVEMDRRILLTVVTDQVGSPSYACELAEGIAQLVAREATGVFHLTNSGSAHGLSSLKPLPEKPGPIRLGCSLSLRPRSVCGRAARLMAF